MYMYHIVAMQQPLLLQRHNPLQSIVIIALYYVIIPYVYVIAIYNKSMYKYARQ